MKHLVDVDDRALDRAKRNLGTSTIKETVNTALRMASGRPHDDKDLQAALDTLASTDFEDRQSAWR